MDLPPIEGEGHLVLQPEALLDTRVRQLRSKVIKEYLIRWRNLPDEDSTWEGENILQHPSLFFLEDKQILGGEDCNIPNYLIASWNIICCSIFQSRRINGVGRPLNIFSRNKTLPM